MNASQQTKFWGGHKQVSARLGISFSATTVNTLLPNVKLGKRKSPRMDSVWNFCKKHRRLLSGIAFEEKRQIKKRRLTPY